MISRIAAVVACVCFAFVSAASGQTCPAPIGEWGYGRTSSVAMEDELVVMDSGLKLLVADLSLPDPAVVGELRLPSTVEAIAVQGTTAYVLVDYTDTSHPRLLTFDVADPADPVQIGSLEIPQTLTDIAVQGDFAYVTSRTGGLAIIDVDDPAAPRILTELQGIGRALRIAVQGDHAYLTTYSGLLVVNVSNPESPVIENLEDAPSGNDIAATQDLLYVLSWDGLVVYDIGDPTDPRYRGEIADMYDPRAVAAVGTTVFVAQAAVVSRLVVVNASNPDTPVKIGEFEQDMWMSDVAASDTTVLISAEVIGSRLIDVSDPSSPELAAELPPPATPGTISDMVIRDGLAFLAGGRFQEPPLPSWGLLRIVDVSSEPAFTEIAALELTDYGYSIAFHGDHVVVAQGVEWDIHPSLDVIDVSDPTNPLITGGVGLGGWQPSQVVVSGNHAFVTNEDLVIVDLSDPSMPDKVSTTSAPTGQWGSVFRSVGVVDDRAYLATSRLGLCVYDLADLVWPEELGCTPTLDWAHWVSVADGRAYVTAGTLGGGSNQLLIFDITEEDTPVQIGSIDLEAMGGRVSVAGQLAYVETTQRGLLVIDVADPTDPVLLGIAPDEDWGIGDGDRLYTVADGRYLDGWDVSSCSNPLPTADFDWWPRDAILSEAIEFSDASAGSPTSWLWDFGDGHTSQEQHPRHTYAVPGNHEVSLTVGNSVGTHFSTDLIEVRSIASRSYYNCVIPAAAHGDGKAGTRWRSDLLIDVPGSSATVAAYLMKRGQDNTLQPGTRLILPPGSTPFDDVVATLFGEDDTAGSISLAANADLAISSRTYTLSGNGTFGQFIPGVSGYHHSGPPVLMQLTQNGDFRTNLGLVNLEGQLIEALVDLYAADGTPLGSTSHLVQPFGTIQVDEFIAELTDEPLDDGYAQLEVSVVPPPSPAHQQAGAGPGSAATPNTSPPIIRYAAYAATVDNLTGDPVFTLPSTPSQHPLWIAAVAHVEGRNGTVWRTDLEICADRSSDVRFRLELLESGGSNTDPPSETFTLKRGVCARYGDVVQAVFDTSTTGALRVVPEAGAVTASSRTYTRRADGGTFGQHVAAVPDSAAFEYWSYSSLVQLSHSADRLRGFRTNVGLVNASPINNVIELRIQTHDMVTLDELTVELRPYEHRQINRILQGLGDDDLENVRIRVSTDTFDGRFIAYASVVDNVTGDAVYIPGQ